MNKILLIGINARFSHPAMALYYLREYVRDLPWNAIIMEFTIHTPVRDILHSIEDAKPDAVAFSVYIWNTSVVQEVLIKLGEMHDRPKIILGGPDTGYNPEDWLARFSFIDCIIQGHGEEAFRSLLAGSFTSQNRILQKDNTPFSQIPFPYTDEDLLSFEFRKIYYETSRGCIFKCAYCLSSREDQRLEFKEISRIKDELAIIMKHKPDIIKFVDRTFNAKQTHAHEVWKHIIDSYSDTGTRFHFEVHPILLAEDDFKLLEGCPTGLFQFEIGIQSTCESALRAVNRTGDWKKIKPQIKRLIRMNTIPVHVDLIAGLPFEDYDTLAFSFNEVYSLNANHFQLGYLKVLPGTEVKERTEEWGMQYSSEPPYEVMENRWLGAMHMKKIKMIAKLTDMIYNSHRFNITLENLLQQYKSPFILFEALARASLRKPAANSEMQWEYLTDLIIDCASEQNLKEDFIIDCLREDWHVSSKSNRMPKKLKIHGTRNNRKGRKVLRDLQNKNEI
jgi:radical SAM superfamily enzyme YgiQ (UPF0313 family)